MPKGQKKVVSEEDVKKVQAEIEAISKQIVELQAKKMQLTEGIQHDIKKLLQIQASEYGLHGDFVKTKTYLKRKAKKKKEVEEAEKPAKKPAGEATTKKK